MLTVGVIYFLFSVLRNFLEFFLLATPWLSVTFSLVDLSDSLKNFLKNGSQNFSYSLNSEIANGLYCGLIVTTSNNQLEFLVEQLRNSDILQSYNRLQNIRYKYFDFACVSLKK